MIRVSPSKITAIHAKLREEILGGRWQVGDKLPTDVELAARFGCSTGTINKAMASLAHEGLVKRKTRSGTSVLRTSPESAAPAASLDAYAFICPNDLHEGIRRIMHGFQDAAREAKRRTLVLTTGLDQRKEAEIIGRLSEFDVKGAAILPLLLGPEERLQFTQMVLACPFPVVLVQMLLPDLGRSAVHIDSLHGGYTMTTHLLRQGLKRIGFLSNYAWSMLMREKHVGYRQAMFEAGLDDECRRFSHLQLDMRPDFDEPLDEPRAIGRAYLKAHPEVEAVVCAGDFLALGLLEAAAELGIRVPEDLKITGMEDLQQSACAPVPLTTYRYPFETLGGTAFETLDRLISKGTDTGEEIQVRGELVVRASAG